MISSSDMCIARVSLGILSRGKLYGIHVYMFQAVFLQTMYQYRIFVKTFTTEGDFSGGRGEGREVEG